MLVDDGLREKRCHDVRLTAGGDNPGLTAQLGAHAADDFLDEPDVAEDDARLDGAGRVSPDGLRRGRERDPWQLRRVMREGIHRGGHARVRWRRRAALPARATAVMESAVPKSTTMQLPWKRS